MLLIVASFLKGNSGTMVGICTKNSGQYILDGTDIGQPAASYTRAKFVYEQVTPPPPPWKMMRFDGLHELLQHYGIYSSSVTLLRQ